MAKRYITNLIKEVNEAMAAGEIAVKARGDSFIIKLPSGKTMKTGPTAAQANAKLKAERGQAAGALIGRKYDKNGKRIK